MKYLFVMLAFMILISMTSNRQEGHRLFTEILQDYVHEGKVNYRELCQDNRLETYIAQLAGTNPDAIRMRRLDWHFGLMPTMPIRYRLFATIIRSRA